jgi:hypothetical protein
MTVALLKEDLAPFGYAPGSSLFYCTDCNRDDPEVGHKHATRCVQHALEFKLAQVRSGEAFQLPVDVQVAVLSLRTKVLTVVGLCAFLWLLIATGISALI